jgi:hypothetical protein
MSNPTKLVGIELVDCAKANAREGMAVACQRCGYGDNHPTFEAELRKACEAMGVKLDDFTDLLEDPNQEKLGVEFAPESLGQL